MVVNKFYIKENSFKYHSNSGFKQLIRFSFPYYAPLSSTASFSIWNKNTNTLLTLFSAPIMQNM